MLSLVTATVVSLGDAAHKDDRQSAVFSIKCDGVAGMPLSVSGAFECPRSLMCPRRFAVRSPSSSTLRTRRRPCSDHPQKHTFFTALQCAGLSHRLIGWRGQTVCTRPKSAHRESCAWSTRRNLSRVEAVPPILDRPITATARIDGMPCISSSNSAYHC